MNKRILLSILLMSCLNIVSSQDQPSPRLQKLRIQMQRMQGIEKVKALNNLARNFMFTNFSLWDSSLYYSRMALELSLKGGFRKEYGWANIILGDGLLQFQRSFEAEKYFRQAVDVAKETRNDTLLAFANRRLGQSLWYQGRFSEAIDLIRPTIAQFEFLGEGFQVINCFTSIADIYNDWGKFEQGFAFSEVAFKLSTSKGDEANVIQCCIMIGSLYASIGDYETAFSYNDQAASYLECTDCYHRRAISIMRGNLHRALGNYDSAMYYLQKGYDGNPTSTLTKLYIAETLLAQKRFDTALQILNFLQDFDKTKGAAAKRWRLNTAIGTAYFGKKDYNNALHYTLNGIRFAEEQGIRGQFIPDAFKMLSTIYKETNRPDSALYYFEQYATVKDSVISDQLKGKLFEFKRIAEDERRKSQIELLKKQRQISEQQLIGGIIIILLFSSLVLWYVSSKRRTERLKNERVQAQLQHKATDLEMQALRSQMNPHFIFNCLSSVNRFILKNETEAASDYLTRFSKLIRLVLVHSRSSMILLKDEIEMLSLYLDMEQLRFRNAFDYSISISKSIDVERVQIPPLLLQPFCENAIWHGLVHKETKGELSLKLEKQNGQLECIIEDNGVGRKKASEYKNRHGALHQSLGLKITGDRLALINKEDGSNTTYTIEDLFDGDGNAVGTKVRLSIHYLEELEEIN